MNRYAFCYFMNEDLEQIRDTVPDHVAYWKGLALPDYSGGPFADRTGGLITFSASGQAEAEKLVSQDPFVIVGVIAKHWLKSWVVGSALSDE